MTQPGDDKERDTQAEDGRTYPAEKARQGEIMLRRRWQRIIFIGGLIACVVIVVLLRLLAQR